MISFVIQGPAKYKTSLPQFAEIGWLPQQDYTSQICIDSLREWYPDCEIIVSCSTGDAQGLRDYDKLVYVTDDMLEHDDNVNRQILTSQAVKYATNDVVCKLRSDMVAGSNWLLPYVKSELLGDNPYKRTESHKMFERFVFISNWSVDRGMYYHPSDWFFLGLKKDVESIFDIPQRVDCDWHIGPEQYIAIRLLEKYGFQEYIDYNWLENHGNINSGTPDHTPPNRECIENWWKLFFNNFCVLNNGWFKKDKRCWRVVKYEDGSSGYVKGIKIIDKNNEEVDIDLETDHKETLGESGLMSKKYLERVGVHRNLINHGTWLKAHEELTK